MTTDRVAGLVLAAGSGERLGGYAKARLVVDDEFLVNRAINALAEAGCSPIIVVLGAGAENVVQVISGGADVVVNDAWASGMGSSLRVGLRALRGRAQAVVIALVDQPGITSESVTTVIEGWQTSRQPAATAVFGGQPCPPVVLAGAIWDDVAQLAEGDQGARVWLRQHPDRVAQVHCDNLADLGDLDTPDDYAAWCMTAAWDLWR